MLKKFVNHLKQAERGQSIIILAIAFVVLLGFVGLTTDVSLMFVRYATIRRAVDSASLAAATQMRQGTEEATVAIAAKQFVEFHGLNSIDVKVESCQTIDRQANEVDFTAEDWAKHVALEEELCTDDQRKLVKVTVQAESPTVFLRLLGWDNFTLQATAISETAALDVVLIMDVSESMLSETSYDDWAKIGMGYAFRPPQAEADIIYPKIDAGDWAGNVNEYWAQRLLAWQTDISTGGMAEVNQRLWYDLEGVTGDPFEVTDAGDDSYYRVKVYDLDTLPEWDSDTYPEFPADVSTIAPRDACRVRFYPAAKFLNPSMKFAREWRFDGEAPNDDVNQVYQQLDLFYADQPNAYPDDLDNTDNWDYSGGTWMGFVPSYDYYGCCNDPGVHDVDGDNLPIRQPNGYFEMDTTENDGDFDFTDLICQPFKGARDAVELFLEKIDFIRGDRVAFVTFDRTAFLINPWDSQGQDEGGSHMIDSYEIALNTLRRTVGVRADPNFYIWDDSGTAGDPLAQWGAFASESFPINYDSPDGSGFYYNDPVNGTPFNAPDDSIYNHSYPVRDFCYYDDAALDAPYSLSNGVFGQYVLPYPQDVNQDGSPASPSWASYDLGGLRYDFFDQPGVQFFLPRIGYEYWAQCRGTNVGAALREGNNALVDPNTSRRFGAIWVMVLLGDGAAGASDPVRRDGDRVTAPQPYKTNPDGTFNPSGGQYGVFGVCPYGTRNQPGELVDDRPEFTASNSFSFPFCSDESPQTRHDCDFRPDDGPEAIRDNLYKTIDQLVEGVDYPADDPRTDGEIELWWNSQNGNLYDLDIGAGCASDYYDVDDYARDWADYVALSDPDSGSDELLPTIYTIGFGLTFGSDGTTAPDASDSVQDYLGEQLLRYIADVGDNNELDNDYYQHYDEFRLNQNETDLPDGFGFRGACQEQYGGFIDDYDVNNNGLIDADEFDTMFEPLPATEDCGNYFNAPSAVELEGVFDSIASKLFTRIAS